MKTMIRGLAVAIGCSLAFGINAAEPTKVEGYLKKDGTYVAPHARTPANRSKLDNWSTKGNVNPYTGKEGTKEPVNPRRPK